MSVKLCKRCNTEKPLDDFHRDRGSPTGRTSYCKSCQISKTKKYYRDHREEISRKDKERYTPERSARMKDDRLRRKYGITLVEYEAMLDAQNRGCAMCGGAEPIQDGRVMAVDHDHKTGRVRGILCSNCNRALGLLKDDPALLLIGAAYLVREEDTVQPTQR